ncbi:hypothetical protein VTK73DRAFT_1541 [Phialemonium thermophilum]|uniref:Heterokaryon incompatibility domain-containing protein n=1 Tax=Phialemonium thermophilum TaxID=223376 RepID=A0ABR3VTD9_9PEZI
MDLPDGNRLCHACAEALLDGVDESEDCQRYRNGTQEGFEHYQSYNEFVTSKQSGCLVCTWIWAELPPPPNSAGTSTASAVFNIYYAVEGTTSIRFTVVSSWLIESKLIFRAQPDRHSETDLDGTIGSSQSLRTIKSWLKSCDELHETCRPDRIRSGHYFPTRILDVQLAEDGIVCLHRGEEIIGRQEQPYPVYWTLSHRWGDPQGVLQLHQNREGNFRNGVSLTDLSPTFRDAALLVRRLGYRYLWIDSLCIIQDSPSDWQREAQAMVEVYRCAICNISAVGASFEPGSSLFRKRGLDPARLFVFRADRRSTDPRTSDSTIRPYFFSNASVWNASMLIAEFTNAPLSRRGWVVQERWLSSRTVHFGREQIYWECFENVACEADPAARLIHVLAESSWLPNSFYKCRRPGPLPSDTLSMNPRKKAREYGIFSSGWNIMALVYANCALTNESDRFVALSGIAKIFRQWSGDTYLAGIWQSTIYTDLAWCTMALGGCQVRRIKSYAPTWSWASVMGADWDRDGLVIQFSRLQRLHESFIKFIEARIVTEPPGGDPTGLLRSVELGIECQLHYYCVSNKLRELSLHRERAMEQPYVEGVPFYVYPDTTELLQSWAEREEIQGVCTPYRAYDRSVEEKCVVYLMLEEDASGRYKRTGIIHTVTRNCIVKELSGLGVRITLV